MGLKPRKEAVDNDPTSVRLRYKNDESDKFWEIRASEKTVTTRWGRTGTGGQTRAKSYATSAAAAEDAKKQILGKRKKGYVEAAAASTTQQFSSEKIQNFPGLSRRLDDKKRFYADLRLKRAKSRLELAISKDRPFDAEPFNRTISHLIEHQEDLLAALRKRGYTDYQANRDYIEEDFDIDDPARQLPRVKSVSEIDRAIDFSRFEINFKEGFGNLQIRCRNTWDVEHQYSVLLLAFEIVDSDCLGEGMRCPS